MYTELLVTSKEFQHHFCGQVNATQNEIQSFLDTEFGLASDIQMFPVKHRKGYYYVFWIISTNSLVVGVPNE